VKIFPHTILKRSVAFLLFGLLLFVHTEKAIHHHEKLVVKEQKNGIPSVVAIFVCSICDYVFAKDAALPEPVVLNTPVNYFQKTNTPELSYFFASVASVITDRGPPAC
jgi:hypothetical protein